MISIIIPVYNAAKYLAETIQSVQAQTGIDWEMVLVNDGSKDDSLAIAEAFARQDVRISVFSQENAGVSTARNTGLARSKDAYPYVLFLDSDDLLLPGALQTLLSFLEAQPEASAACGFVQDIDSEGRLLAAYHHFESLTHRRGVDGLRLVLRNPDASLAFADLCFYNFVTTPGQVLVRRSSLETAGNFNVLLAYIEDYEMWWRIAMQVGPIAVTQEPVLAYRHHGSSLSSNKAVLKRSTADWRRTLLTHPKLSVEQKRVARVGYLYHCLVRGEYALFYLRGGKIKQGLKMAGLGVRDLLQYARDLVRLRRQNGVSSQPQSAVR